MTDLDSPYQESIIDFYGAQIEISPSVLIPRLETEILVEHVLERLGDTKTLLDLCTGSGCIAIALKKKRPDLHICASDISAKALTLARQNAQNNQVDIDFFLGDGFDPLQNKTFDAIVCNPPYIGLNETISPRVKNYEPHEALFSGEDGFDFFRMLEQKAPLHLSENGKLFLEIGYQQGKKLLKLFATQIWSQQELIQDWSSKDRFFFLEKTPLLQYD